MIQKSEKYEMFETLNCIVPSEVDVGLSVTGRSEHDI